MINKNFVNYLIQFQQALLYRHTLIDIFTEVERISITKSKGGHFELEHHQDPFFGMLVVYEDSFYAITEYQEINRKPETSLYRLKVTPLGFKDNGKKLCKPTDSFILQKGNIINFKESKPIETTVGRFVVNYLLLADPFGDLIPYQNKTFKGAKGLETLVSNNILSGNINASQERKYGANLLFLSSNPEYFAPSLTKKVLTTGSHIKARKKELLEKYKEEIASGDVVTIAKIEKELVDMDKAYCKGDPSMVFLMKDSYFSNIRKKLFIIHGAIPSFGKKGEYDFIPNSLEEGWTEKDFPKIVNEVRDGTHSRSTEVAKGGEQSNFILRIFQNTRITEEDCGVKHGLKMHIHEGNYKDFIERNILINGKTVSISPENAKSYIGKDIILRSPMYCRGKNGGVCYKCTDKRFEETKQDTLATIMNTLGAMFSTLALKKVHNTSVSSTRLKDIDTYIL